MSRHNHVEPGFDAQPLRRPDGMVPLDEVHVWWARLDVPDGLVGRLSELLSADERERALRFKVAVPGRRFIIGRAFLRLALGQYLQAEPGSLQFKTGSYGKPALASDRELQFNLSHSEHLAVVAIARRRQVGVDVELMRAEVNAVELADRFFSAPEADWVRSQPNPELTRRFFICWTAKEAYVKACGEGLSLPLKNFSVLPSPGSAGLQLHVFDNPDESQRWTLWPLQPAGDFRGAVAVEGQSCTVRQGQWLQEWFA